MRKTTMRRAWLTFCAAMLLAACAPGALAQGGTEFVTGEGFEKLAAKSTLYATVPMYGIIGIDCPGESVNQTLKAAAADKHIKHAVFMIDSYRGIPIERKHVGEFDKQLEITAVVRNAMGPAIFPVFFANKIFMTESALVGNLPLARYVAKGSKEVAAKQVGIYSSMLASAAQSRGHAAAIAYAMIDDKKDLWYWKQDGKIVLSNSRPNNLSKAKGLTRYGSSRPGVVLTLDQRMAKRVGFAKSIDTFDPVVVGEYLGKTHWHQANHFGRVANEIGAIGGQLDPLRKFLREWDNQIGEKKFEGDRKSDAAKGFREFKRTLDGSIDQIDLINKSLKKLLEVHPERHAYFTAKDGKTIVADPQKWAKDLTEAKREAGRAYAMLRKLTDGFRTLGFDEEHLYKLNQKMKVIQERLMGISRFGNAVYWRDHAKPDLPGDIYG